MGLGSKILRGGDPEDEANWLECIPFTGYSKRFPDGVIMPPGIKDVTSLIKSVTVLDAESEEGFRVLRKSEVSKDMEIISVQLNEKSIALIAGPAGADSDAILIVDPNGGQKYTRLGWYDHHGQSDGLAMVAAVRFLGRLKGPGVFLGVGK